MKSRDMETNHLVAVLEAGESHLRNRVLFMSGLLGRYNRCISGEREVDAREAVCE
jgi:hypothetical protein